jgi:molecular chaperone GrpE (heat shock protein)
MEKSWNSEALVYLRDLRKSELTVYEEVRAEILDYKKHINNKVDIYVELLIQQLTTSWMTLNDNFTRANKQALLNSTIFPCAKCYCVYDLNQYFL